MKVSPGSGRLRSGEVNEPVELLRPLNLLIRRVPVSESVGVVESPVDATRAQDPQ